MKMDNQPTQTGRTLSGSASSAVASGSATRSGAGLARAMKRLGIAAAVTAGLGATAAGYARFESRRPTLRKTTVTVPAGENFSDLRILHISDLHMFRGQDFIARFLQKVAQTEQIDLVVSTGDNLGEAGALELLLEAYQPLLRFPGAFVLGSNDYYSPQTRSPLNYLQRNRGDKAIKRHEGQGPDLPWYQLVEELVGAGWKDLSNRADTVTIPGAKTRQIVSMVGVDDPHIRRDRMPQPQWQPGSLHLAVTHAPYRRVLDRFADLGADLILAGHTHGGQIRVPGLGALVNNCDIPKEFSRGMHEWIGSSGRRTLLNVSAGLGTSPFVPLRFACRPEATLIHVVGQ